MSKFTTDVYILPSHWSTYLLNGDGSGLTDAEIEEVEDWCAANDNPRFVSVGDDYFSWSNDANMKGGNVADFTVLVEEDEYEGEGLPKPPSQGRSEVQRGVEWLGGVPRVTDQPPQREDEAS
jgi:hypothetical protein